MASPSNNSFIAIIFMLKIFILRVCYIMAFSRQIADVVGAIFDDDFGLSDEEDSDIDDGNDVYGYLGHSVISRAEIMDAAGAYLSRRLGRGRSLLD